MKLLYLSCHAILEYDECRIFNDLGIDWFALGSYLNPHEPVDPIRPSINKTPNRYLMDTAPMRDNMPRSFINNFDVIVFMDGEPAFRWISQNWETMRGKRVILRTIGQSTIEHEEKLRPFRNEGLQIVRYSPMEINIPGNLGCDAMIRFSKDPEEFKGWNGADKQVINFTQNMIERGEHCHFDIFKQATEGFRRKLYGPKNENAGDMFGGFLTYDELKQKMRDNRVYFYTGTQPASYTLNFMEAFMTGIPIVAIGATMGNSKHIAGDLYEIPEMIQNTLNGFYSDDINELRRYIQALMDDDNLAKRISEFGRRTAIDLFGIEKIKSQWKQFLGI